MTLIEAYEKAVSFFKENAVYDIACALDAETHWIFYPGKSNEIEIGSAGIKIEKAGGVIEPFVLPDDENFELLDRSVKMDIPGQTVQE